MAIEIVSFPIKNGGSFHSNMLVYQRVAMGENKKHIQQILSPCCLIVEVPKCMAWFHMAVCQNLVPLVNIKIAGKWMFIPLKIVY